MVERKRWEPGPWASGLPKAYFDEMGILVDDMTRGWFSERDYADGHAELTRVRQIFGRMEIAQTQIMPWLFASIPDIKSKAILEIGCGTGSATAPLAMASRHVFAFDLGKPDIAAARCRLLGLDNVTLFTEKPGWTESYASDPRSICELVDIVFCYALFEHLLPLERIDLLLGAWSHLPIGGHLVVIETPNRLYPYDWHSSYLPFVDQLPEEIAYLWNSFSPRASMPADIKASSRSEAAKGNRERLYRFGRGASFHEFHVTLGVEAYAIDNASVLDRSKTPGWNKDYIAALEQQLAEVRPPVNPIFAQPYIDIVVRKTGPARLPLTATKTTTSSAV
jgi:SAM-dependent methyltransferase